MSKLPKPKSHELHFQVESLEERQMLSVVSVAASGDQNGEAFNVVINGQVEGSFYVDQQTQQFQIETASDVKPEDIRIEFADDGDDAKPSIEYFAIDGEQVSSESIAVELDPSSNIAREDTETSTITLTGDDQIELYVNGKRVDLPHGDQWFHSDILTGLSLNPGDVIAIEARDNGEAAGIVGAIELFGETIGTSSDWKVSNDRVNGWNGVSFDDADWANAVEISKYGEAIWGTAAGEQLVGKEANWIWSDNNSDLAFFRFTLPGNTETEPAAPVAIEQPATNGTDVKAVVDGTKTIDEQASDHGVVGSSSPSTSDVGFRPENKNANSSLPDLPDHVEGTVTVSIGNYVDVDGGPDVMDTSTLPVLTATFSYNAEDLASAQTQVENQIRGWIYRELAIWDQNTEKMTFDGAEDDIEITLNGLQGEITVTGLDFTETVFLLYPDDNSDIPHTVEATLSLTHAESDAGSEELFARHLSELSTSDAVAEVIEVIESNASVHRQEALDFINRTLIHVDDNDQSDGTTVFPSLVLELAAQDAALTTELATNSIGTDLQASFATSLSSAGEIQILHDVAYSQPLGSTGSLDFMEAGILGDSSPNNAAVIFQWGNDLKTLGLSIPWLSDEAQEKIIQSLYSYGRGVPWQPDVTSSMLLTATPDFVNNHQVEL
ncbi:MAG: hypothetical protein AAGA30_08350, partial [Planctomycetota bacterium]